MAIPLTCSCGARLEIDDKFAGQTIPCPDCHKPLIAELPRAPATRTSGLAVLSLLLALVGAFTVIGTLAAIACGAVAYRQITRSRGSVGGLRLAQAGMILGAVFTVLALATYGSRSLLGIDGLLRQYQWASKLQFPTQLVVSKKRVFDDRTYSLERPSPIWGELATQTQQRQNDHLMLVNLRDDAHILWLSDIMTPDDDAASLRARAVDCFRASELVRMIGRMPENVSESLKERGVDEEQRVQEFFLDISLGGIPRTFLFRLVPDGQHVNVIIGGARTHRFGGLEATFRRTLDTFKQEVGP
jgi:hypothetical protein